MQDYTDMGIRFDAEPVAQRNGPNGSDKRTLGMGQIAVPVDLEKIRVAFGDDAVMGSLNGTSWRVMSQDISRRGILAKHTVEQIQLAIVNRLKGIRNSSGKTPATITKYALPDGKFYSGTDVMEYRQAIIAAYIDLGIVDLATAKLIAENMTL